MSHQQKTVWILIGPNGAGKSTFAANPPDDLKELRTMPYLNPDPILDKNFRLYGPNQECLRQTSAEMDSFIWGHLNTNHSFMVEKVSPTLGFIGASFVDLQRQGWSIATIAIGLNNSDLSKQRVRQRVAQGGHDVLIADLNAAFRRHMALMPDLIELSDFARIYDNSSNGYTLLAEKNGSGKVLLEANTISKSSDPQNPYLSRIMRKPAL